MKIQPNTKVVMIGDSITDCGRTRSVGENWYEPLGNGYVSYVNGLLQAAYPSAHYLIINQGISGDTVRDLRVRWQKDVLDLNPDWVSISIGVNDALRHFDAPVDRNWLVPLDEFERTLEELVRSTKQTVKGLVLIAPCWIDTNLSHPKRGMVDQYSGAVRRLAGQYQVLLVDAQAVFDHALHFFDSGALAWDHVHPTHTGHMFLARAFLNTVAFQWK